MYNVFKRPMFKLGGQADQGTGIMSHVEPRSNYMFGNIAQPLTPFQDTYTNLPAYAYGGRIGYAGAGPVMPGTLPGIGFKKPSFYPTTETETVTPTAVDDIGIATLPQSKMASSLEKFKNMPTYNPFSPIVNYFKRNTTLDDILLQEGFITKDSTLPEIMKARKDYREKYLKQSPAAEFTKPEGGETPEEVKPKKTEFEETTTTDPRTKIREEADMLKSMLRDEGLTTAENALIVAKALATPGGINAKIAAAGEMAIPVLRERAKLDKEATLEAYKTMKEIEKTKISAGALSAQMKGLEETIRSQKAAAVARGTVTYKPDGTPMYDGLTEAELREKVYATATGKFSAGAYEKAVMDTATAKRKLQEELSKSTQQQNKQMIDKLNQVIEQNYQLYKIPKAEGGRITKAAGGMTEEDNTSQDMTGETTDQVVETNVQGFPERAVQKLSFEQIRTRLPKEITDDIVRLLANSSEALQDFAYIRTQEDINKFNVKYGVNLILPQNA